MEFRTLDLTILSANDLKRVNFFSRMDVYVVVSVMDSGSTILTQRTPVHNKGDKNPSWNSPINFTINDAAAMHNRLTLRFQVVSKRVFPGHKLIGEVFVPVSELLSGHADPKHSSSLSYQLRGRNSQNPKGVLKFSCKFGDKFTGVGGGTGQPTGYPYPYPYPNPPQQQPMSGYPAPPPTAYPYQGPPPTAYPYEGYGKGYGYGNGYPTQTQTTGGRRNNNKFGMGMGAGLLGGALAGMVLGDLVSDVAHDGGYDDGGYDGGFDDGGYDGGFDDGGFDDGGFDF